MLNRHARGALALSLPEAVLMGMTTALCLPFRHDPHRTDRPHQMVPLVAPRQRRQPDPQRQRGDPRRHAVHGVRLHGVVVWRRRDDRAVRVGWARGEREMKGRICPACRRSGFIQFPCPCGCGRPTFRCQGCDHEWSAGTTGEPYAGNQQVTLATYYTRKNGDPGEDRRSGL